MRQKPKTTDIWDRYQKGKDHHQTVDMYNRTDRAHRFYSGDQWHGLKNGGEELPLFNFIKPVIKYKTSMLCQVQSAIIFTPMSTDELTARSCNVFTEKARKQWELMKMDTLMWGMVKNAAIAGDHYYYCYNSTKQSGSLGGSSEAEYQARLINKTNIYFSDEQNPNINEQEWIIIKERLPVERIRKEAKQYGVSADEIKLIVSDEETSDEVGQDYKTEVKTDSGKCTSLLFMRLTDEGLSFCRSVKQVIYKPEETITGLDAYPVCGMRWEEKLGDARGLSGVEGMIPNQLEVNKTAARRSVGIKRFTYPLLAVDDKRIQNTEKLSHAGATIHVSNMSQNPIENSLRYIAPPPMSSDAERYQDKTIQVTQTLEGAGDAALGQVDPENASGEAIKAARDQAAVPLNEQAAAYKQFVEDVARLWYKLWVAYSPESAETTTTDEYGVETPVMLTKDDLRRMDVNIRIDISPTDPISQLSQDVALENLFVRNMITFEEYVEALSEGSSVPKQKLMKILKNRSAQQAAEPDVPLVSDVPTELQQQAVSQFELPAAPPSAGEYEQLADFAASESQNQ